MSDLTERLREEARLSAKFLMYAEAADRIAELEDALREIDHAFELRQQIDIEGGGFGWSNPIRDIARRALGDNDE